jgi:hypothetical protein
VAAIQAGAQAVAVAAAEVQVTADSLEGSHQITIIKQTLIPKL